MTGITDPSSNYAPKQRPLHVELSMRQSMNQAAHTCTDLEGSLVGPESGVSWREVRHDRVTRVVQSDGEPGRLTA